MLTAVFNAQEPLKAPQRVLLNISPGRLIPAQNIGLVVFTASAKDFDAALAQAPLIQAATELCGIYQEKNSMQANSACLAALG
ncbi:hypothetical protein [Erwinia sp. HR93]|uniref:hypothetical protein n=1 Tax=Erwinia sp. HR93 TaxID=3094840 RepID=UPI002ADEF818|nr:hypothetical protein [Erwinia sp. HR93]MEA1064094.1 hypothetical protein [Erwinia sp. HR93]